MKKQVKNFLKNLSDYQDFRVTFFLVFISATFVYTGYQWSVSALHDYNNKHLLEISKVAALQFDPVELEQIQKTENTNLQVYKKNVEKISKVREENSDIFSIYILRKSKDKEFLKFILDADYYDKDKDGDGQISLAEKAILPGDEYEVADAPLMLEGFKKPVFENEIYEDLRGATKSAYAPIFKDGEEFAILGVDLLQDVYLEQVCTTKQFRIGLFVLLVILTFAFSYHLRRQRILYEKNLEIQKEKKKLQELNKLQSSFISLIGHEFKTPLSVIKGYSSILQKEASSKKLKSLAEKISKNSERLVNATEDILSLGEFESGTEIFDFKKISLNEILNGLASEIELLAKEKGLKFNYKFSEKVSLDLDEEKIKKAFFSLLANSVKFTSQGEVSLEVKKEKNFIKIKISDTGRGISEEKVKTIFDKFTQTKDYLERDFEGLGLGLTIANLIVKGHNGKIKVESTEGKGTIFEISLPV